jgi:hypothetical protein
MNFGCSHWEGRSEYWMSFGQVNEVLYNARLRMDSDRHPVDSTVLLG